MLALLCAMSFILYLDRVCMGQALKSIEAELGLERWQTTWVTMAFTVAYGLFEIPTGRLGDRLGARRVLTRIVVWWSVFTMLTGACWNFFSLLVVRFLFGAGEAGAYPNAARVISRWFPAAERGRVQGLMLAAGQAGASLSPGLTAQSIASVGWREAFALFGLVGVVWAIVFWRWFHDDPAQHPNISSAELQTIGRHGAADEHGSIPWRRVARNRTILLLGLIVTCTAFVAYLYLSWYPTYLQEARGVSLQQSGWLASLALAGGGLGLLSGGLILDRITKRSANPLQRRRWAATASHLSAAVLLLLAVGSDSPTLSAGFAAASCFAMFVPQSAWWSCAIEVSGPHVGALFGLMNGVGVVGAISSQFFFGRFPEWRGQLGFVGRAQWDPAFYVCVGLLLLAAFSWQWVNPLRDQVEPIAKTE
ncbi:MAG: MFS transporter [Gemmataceae bacterium]|nr:MFS transporter [Gemmataceae bacterium]